MDNFYIPYEQKLHRPPDFRVKYRFYTEEEGGRKTMPYQGYRCDFWYYHELQPNPHSIYMIWPEFEDTNGKIITDTTQPISRTGTASMLIIMPPMRALHRERITPGLTGYFMEGRRIAECTVIEILGLKTNPLGEHPLQKQKSKPWWRF